MHAKEVYGVLRMVQVKAEFAEDTEKARKRVAVVQEVGELAQERGFRVFAAWRRAVDTEEVQHPVLQSDGNLG